MMGGKLKVKSELDKGSTFYFSIKLPELEQPPISSSSQWQRILGYEGPKYTILVVDDIQENCLFLKHILESWGFEIVTAENGQQEIDLAVEIRPDLILSDILMPVKDGIEAIKEIRQISELKDIPIIAVSATVSSAQRQESLKVGFDDFLPQPISVEELLQQLQKYLQLEWIYESVAETQTAADYSSLVPPPVDILKKLT